MGSFGWSFAGDFGGAPSGDEKMYNALRSMLGKGGISVIPEGIDDLEIQADALALAAIAAFDERAALQIFPNLAIDAIPSYEAILGIVPGKDDPEDAERQAVAADWVARNSAEIPTLTERLQAIDSRLSVLDDTWANAKVTHPGMPFWPYVKLSWMNDLPMALLPLYSSRSEFYVLLNLGTPGTIPGPAELDVIAQVTRLLKIVLPAEVIPYITTEVGLIAGVSPVGYAGVTGS